MEHLRTYRSHWLTLSISTNSPELATLLDQFFDFPDVESSAAAIVITCEVRVQSRQGLNSACSHTGHIDQRGRYQTQLGELWANVGCDPASGTILSTVYKPFSDSPEQLLDFCIHQPLQLILQSRGLTYLHASAVVRDDRAILISGRSGSGKSSTALILSQHGYSHLADDDVFITTEDERCSVYALPTKIGIREFILEARPELRQELDPTFRFGEKQRISSDAIGRGQSKTAPSAVLLLLPRYEPESPLALTALEPDDWLAKLSDEHLIRFPEGQIKTAEQVKNFEAFFNLSRAVRAYSLRYCEKSLQELPPAIDQILQAIR